MRPTTEATNRGTPARLSVPGRSAPARSHAYTLVSPAPRDRVDPVPKRIRARRQRHGRDADATARGVSAQRCAGPIQKFGGSAKLLADIFTVRCHLRRDLPGGVIIVVGRQVTHTFH